MIRSNKKNATDNKVELQKMAFKLSINMKFTGAIYPPAGRV